MPFNVNFLSVADHDDPAVAEAYRTSVWETTVAVYDDVDNVNSYVSMSWRNGQGPGTGSVDRVKPWSACVLAVPDLLSRIPVTGKGNGSCIDVADSYCLYGLESMAQAAFEVALGQVDDFNGDDVAQACLSIHELPISPGCWKDKSDTASTIKGMSHSPQQHLRDAVPSRQKCQMFLPCGKSLPSGHASS